MANTTMDQQKPLNSNKLHYELPLFGKALSLPQYKQQVFNQYAKFWDKQRVHNQIAPNPVSLESKDVATIATNEYVVGEKSDGIRYVMVCSHWDMPQNKGPYAVLLDRNMTIFEIKIKAEESIFRGTVLDGEIVTTNDSTLLYLVFDLVCDRGISCMQMDFVERQRRLFELLSLQGPKLMSNEDSSCIQIVQKIFTPLNSLLEKGMELDPQRFINHKSDGWIFVPVRCGIKTLRHTTMFKFKQDHTIDVQIIRTERHQYGVSYYVDGNPTVGPFVDPHNTNLKIEMVLAEDWLKTIQELGGLNVNGIYECNLEERPNQPQVLLLHLIRLRTDKNTPNDLFTISKTLVNYREKITPDYLLDLIKESRSTMLIT